MPISIELYESMCAFLDGKMSLQEEKAFLELVAKDPELRKELEWEEEMLQNAMPEYENELVIASDAGIRELPVEEPQQSENQVVAVKPVPYLRWAIAASVLLLTIATIWIMNSKQHSPGGEVAGYSIEQGVYWKDTIPGTHPVLHKETLLAKVDAPMKQAINRLGRYTPNPLKEPALLGKVQTAYTNGRYEEAISVSYSVSQTRGGDTDSAKIAAYNLLYRALSQLEINSDAAALQTIRELLNKKDNDPALVFDARWALVKIYAKLGDKKNATTLLNELRKSPGFPYKAEAGKLADMIRGIE